MRGFHVKITKHVLATVPELNWSGRQQLERLWVTFFQLLCSVKSVGKLINATFARHLLDTVKKLYLKEKSYILLSLSRLTEKKFKFDECNKVQVINRSF